MKKEGLLIVLLLLTACANYSQSYESVPGRAIGFIGCSNTMQTVYGYRWTGGEKLWFVDKDNVHEYDSGAVGQWANDPEFWEKFDKYLEKNPKTSKIWWQLCLPQDQSGITYDEAIPVIETLREKIPNVKIYVSPLAEYTETVCEITGIEGIERGKTLAKELDENNDDVFIGPILGPLEPDEIWPQQDHCHPNEEGMGKMGRQLKEFFDGEQDDDARGDK